MSLTLRSTAILTATVVAAMLMECAAQERVHDQASYDAWKAATYGVPLTTAPATAPTRATPPAVAKGGGGVCDCWIQPDGSYTTIDNNTQWNANGWNNADDGSYGPIALPFSFDMYGQLWNTVYININGNVSFGNYLGTFTASGFPYAGTTLAAPFWADVDLRGPGAGLNIVQYKVTPTAMYVNWTNVGYFSQQTNLLNTFQVIITDGTDPAVNGANVSFCYKDMQWTTGAASGGTNGFGGSAANVGANHGNGVDYMQFTRVDQAGAAYDGPFGLNDGIDFLDNQYFKFSTDITSANVPPIITGQSACDSIIVCVGIPVQLDVTFLSPEPNQITTANSYSTTLSNYTIVSNTSGVSAAISTLFTPTMADVGNHVIVFEGTDNGLPVLTSTLSMNVLVMPPAVPIAPATYTTCNQAPGIDLFTLFAPGTPAGGTWIDPNGNAHSGMLNPATDVSGAYVYDVGGAACTSVGTVTVTIQSLPDAGTPGSGTYCADNATVDLFTLLGGTPDAGGAWTDPNNAVHSGTLDPSADLSGTYTYTITGINPCPSASSTVTITIHQPVDPGTDNTLALCRADALIDLFTVLGGTPDAGGAWTDPANAAFNNPIDPAIAAPGSYTYTMTGTAPCPTLSAVITVTADPVPYAGEDAVFDICKDGSNTVLFNLLTGGPDGGGAWHAPSMAAHSGTLLPATDASGLYRYVAYGVGACNALSDTSIVDVLINPLPDVQFAAVPVAGCAPLDVEFTNNTDPLLSDNCSWDFGDGGTGTSTTSELNTYTNPGLYTVSLTVTTDSGCVSNLTLVDMIVVEQPPSAEFTAYPNPATISQSVVALQNDDPQAVVWAWTITEQGTNELLGTSDERDLAFEFPNDLGGLYDVCLAVQDIYGCVDTVCRVVEIRNPLLVFVPNTFTPDGDGVNDLFFPSILGSDPEQYSLMVFDRWGSIVFQSTDLQQAWDGKHRNGGEVLQQGLYTWLLKTAPEREGGKKEYRGHVTLIK